MILAADMLDTFANPRLQAIGMLFAGAMLLLFCTLAATRRLLASDDLSPGRRAIAQFIPIVIASLVAFVMGERSIAVGLLFGTAAASLAAVTGLLALIGPAFDEPTPHAAKVLGFLPVPIILAF